MDGIAMLKHVFLCCHTTISSSKYEYFMYGHRIKHSLLHTTSFESKTDGRTKAETSKLLWHWCTSAGQKVIQLLATHRFSHEGLASSILLNSSSSKRSEPFLDDDVSFDCDKFSAFIILFVLRVDLNSIRVLPGSPFLSKGQRL